MDRFESLVAEGRRALAEGDALTAAERLREALGLWRGPPLADFAYESFAQAEIARLEEARLAALEERIDAELALGEHARLVGELEALVRPASAARAPHRSADARAVPIRSPGRRARELSRRASRLVEELGLEPGRELQQLERAILAQDPGWIRRPADCHSRAAPDRSSRRGAAGSLIAAGGACLARARSPRAAVERWPALARAPSGWRRTRWPRSTRAATVSSRRLRSGARPGAIAFGSGSLWVANLDDQTVSRVDPGTLRTLRTISVAGPPTGIAARHGRVWVVGSSREQRVRLGRAASTREFDAIGRTVRIGNVVPGGPGAVAARGDTLWVAPSSGPLTRLDPRDRAAWPSSSTRTPAPRGSLSATAPCG